MTRVSLEIHRISRDESGQPSVIRPLRAVPLLAVAMLLWMLPKGPPLSARTYYVAQQHPQASDSNPGTQTAPWKTISKAASELVPGDTVVIHAGVYREWVWPARSGSTSAPLVFQAAPGESVMLTGADVITGWVRSGKDVWKKEPWPYRFPIHPNNANHRLIGRCEQAIVDGRLLRQVEQLEQMQEGTCCADTQANVLYVWLAGGEDPNKHLVEASVRPVCFGPKAGNEARDHIVLQGLTIRFAANTAQRGALRSVGDGWIIEGCVVEWTNGSGISFRGDDVTLRRVRSHHNGQQGLGGGGRRFLLEEVTLDHNNLKGFDQDWEAGGAKITHSRDGLVRRCRMTANRGVGLWFDIDVRDVRVEQCFAQDNARHGIYVEISGGFTIRNNVCVHNGTEGHWGSGGIAVAESDDCTVEHNICVLNPTGISIRELGPRTCRSADGRQVTYHVHDITVRRNICALNSLYQVGLWWDNPFFGPHPTASRGASGVAYDPDRNQVRFDENLYWTQDDQQLALWGCPWRPKHRRYENLRSWQQERRQDGHSLFADPLFVAPAQNDWRLQDESPAHRLGAGLMVPPSSTGSQTPVD